METIERKILNFIRTKKLIEPGDRILVALSGGPDSVSMLHFLYSYKDKLKIELGAIHINHLIRGKAAHEDEDFCRNLCLNLNVKFFAVRKNVRLMAGRKKVSLEEAGHKIRYNEFDKIAVKYGFNKIATAHNSSDNIETILLNLIKGTGINGISGIPFKRNNIIRPLLRISKEDILSYIDKNNLNYRLDKTNFSSDYERNFLRNEIIPLIKQRLNPDIENSFSNSSEIFRNASEFIDLSVKAVLRNSSVNLVKGVIKIPEEVLKNCDPLLQGFLVKNILDEKLLVQFSNGDIKKIISLLSKETGKSEELSGKYKALKEREDILIFSTGIESRFENTEVNAGENIKLNKNILAIKEVENIPCKFSGSKRKEYISAEKINGPFILREWKNGDRFYPLGFKGSKKISDFLNEQKISPFKKKEQLVLLNGNKIVWVVGLRLDERFKITNQTKKVYELWLK